MKKTLTIIAIFCSLITFGQTGVESSREAIDQVHLIKIRQEFWDNLPKPTGWVNDFEGLYSEKEAHSLDSIIQTFNGKTSIQIAVVTIDSLFCSKDNFDDLTLHIGNTWGVGQKGKDNGVLIGISRGHKRIRIQNGYGIEKLITDAETKTINKDYFIPDFKHENYYQGTLTGLINLIELLNTKIK